MFKRLSGRQAAGWGYGIFWIGLLIETGNTIHAALSGHSLESPVFWVGQAATFVCTVGGIAMLMSIKDREW